MVGKRPEPIYTDTFRPRWHWWVIAVIIVAVIIGAGVRWYWAHHQTVATTPYPVNGTLLTQTDGDVDWQTLQRVGCQFVIIRAAQGASYQDDRFPQNADRVVATTLEYAVLSDVSFDTTPAAQVANLEDAVGDHWGQLPVILRLTLYGDYAQTPPSQQRVTALLADVSRRLRTQDGQTVAVMASAVLVRRYHLADHYPVAVTTGGANAVSHVGLFANGTVPQSDLPLWTFKGTQKAWSTWR